MGGWLVGLVRPGFVGRWCGEEPLGTVNLDLRRWLVGIHDVVGCSVVSNIVCPMSASLRTLSPPLLETSRSLCLHGAAQPQSRRAFLELALRRLLDDPGKRNVED